VKLNIKSKYKSRQHDESEKQKKYHIVGTVPKSRKNKNKTTTLSEQFQNIEKITATLSEQLQNLEKNLPH
jgi:hypothetical protein